MSEQFEEKKDKVSSHYDFKGEKIKRLLPFCERCGPGYFMADHKNRFACGNCGFTMFKTEEDNKK